MVAPTPAQAAYERAQANMRRRFPGIAPIAWEEIDEEAHADWAGVASDAIDARDEARALLDHETRLTWQSGLPGERTRVAGVRESAGPEAL